eukprot:c14488_g1_i1.p1 GENE.c14488_g1_i1~~c14488_g1_i1.p1  ORF type:complete len:373 (-),score=73.28 c14488_g1_i1:104-1222(-)
MEIASDLREIAWTTLSVTGEGDLEQSILTKIKMDEEEMGVPRFNLLLTDGISVHVFRASHQTMALTQESLRMRHWGAIDGFVKTLGRFVQKREPGLTYQFIRDDGEGRGALLIDGEIKFEVGSSRASSKSAKFQWQFELAALSPSSGAEVIRSQLVVPLLMVCAHALPSLSSTLLASAQQSLLATPSPSPSDPLPADFSLPSQLSLLYRSLAGTPDDANIPHTWTRSGSSFLEQSKVTSKPSALRKNSSRSEPRIMETYPGSPELSAEPRVAAKRDDRDDNDLGQFFASTEYEGQAVDEFASQNNVNDLGDYRYTPDEEITSPTTRRTASRLSNGLCAGGGGVDLDELKRKRQEVDVAQARQEKNRSKKMRL